MEILKSIPDTTNYGIFGRRLLSARALSKTGKQEQAAETLYEALTTARTDHAEDPKKLAESLTQVALGFLDVKLFAEAKSLFHESNQLLSDVKLPSGAPLPFIAQSGLGASLAGLEKYDEAEGLLVSGAEGLLAKRIEPPFPTPREVAAAIKRVIRFYELTKQPGKATNWQNKF